MSIPAAKKLASSCLGSVMLTDERIDVATRAPHGLSEWQGGPYEHPSMEEHVVHSSSPARCSS